MRTITKIFTTTILLSFAWAIQAKVIYVDGFANNGGDGSSWENAFITIGEALSAAVSGDEIWVASDIYYGQYIMKAGVSVYGGFEAIETQLEERDFVKNRTILRNNNGLVLKNQNGLTEDAYFDGFDITGRTTSGNGGGGYLSPKMHLRNSRILNCVSEKGTGGGIALDHGASVENCIFAGNSSQGVGGGLNMNKGGFAKNCIFINNFSRGSSGGGIAASCSIDGVNYPVIVNCLVANNETYNNGGGVWTQGGLIVNCTFVNNKTHRSDAQGNGGGISLDGLASADKTYLLRGGEMYNCVIWGNDINKDAPERRQIFIPSQNNEDGSFFHRGKLSNCAIQDLADIEESEYGDDIINMTSHINLAADNSAGARFVNPSNTIGHFSGFNPIDFSSDFDIRSYASDWSIGENSVLIDAGDNNRYSYENTDLAGNTRIANNTIDLGAYEYDFGTSVNTPKEKDFVCYVSANGGELVFSSTDIRNAKIYSLSGMLIKELKVRSGSANISHLSPGAYIVSTDKVVQKIIK